MPTPLKGRADYYAPGQWNVACSLCGRKRKSGEVVRNWQGLYRCPEHNEPRQPQDFARGIKDVMTVPFAQPESDQFVNVDFTFPFSIAPAILLLSIGGIDLTTESGAFLDTESNLMITSETGFGGSATGIAPGWITIVSYAWSFSSGGAGIFLSNTDQMTCNIQSLTPGVGGVLQCVAVSSLGSSATAYVTVTSQSTAWTADSNTTADSTYFTADGA